MIGVFDFLCDLFLLHSPKRGGRGGRGSRVVILGSCFFDENSIDAAADPLSALALVPFH